MHYLLPGFASPLSQSYILLRQATHPDERSGGRTSGSLIGCAAADAATCPSTLSFPLSGDAGRAKPAAGVFLFCPSTLAFHQSRAVHRVGTNESPRSRAMHWAGLRSRGRRGSCRAAVNDRERRTFGNESRLAGRLPLPSIHLRTYATTAHLSVRIQRPLRFRAPGRSTPPQDFSCIPNPRAGNV